jgi:sigma-B regulation protein RsbU (phosphoserine phosphatase)
MVVGAFPFARYDESQIKLEADDLVVFFTDGMTEPENAYGEMFGEDRLMDILVRNANRSDREIIDSVMEAVQEWTGAGELQDDMTLFVMRRR